VSVERHKGLVRRYYTELWNRWELSLIEELIAPDVTFRGSLGLVVRGHAGFAGYVTIVRTAFPDFHNAVEELIGEEDRVVARLTYRGTHRGPLFGLPPTGRAITYGGVAIFRIAADRIADGWVLGDTLGLLRQLGGTTIPPA
jgi:steroid delta-isomerase-like uncharacterized protein